MSVSLDQDFEARAFVAGGLQKCRKAFQEGRLQAQVPSSSSGACCYRHPQTGAPCAIGAMIPDDVMKRVLERNPAFNSFPVGILFGPGGRLKELPLKQLRDLQTLQNEHDKWAGGMSGPENFEDVLERLENEYGVPYARP